MALWQYDFELKVKEQIKSKLVLKELISIFGEVFEKDDFHIDFGSYEKDRCTLYLKNGLVSNFECRLDLRILNKKKLEKLFDFVKKYNLKILIIEEKIIGENEFFKKIKNSKNQSFLEKGEKFFEELEKED